MLNFELSTLIFNLSIYFAILYLIHNSNILFSVLALILVACLFSLYIINFSSFFVGLLYLAIYVGAVTVFILFVVMMTDLSFTVEQETTNQSTTTLGLLNYCYKSSKLNVITRSVLVFSLVLGFTELVEYTVLSAKDSIKLNLMFDIINKPDSQTFELSFILLQELLAPFIILGLIILITLIGSIFIIIQKDKQVLGVGVSSLFITLPQLNRKSQDMDNQLVIESKGSLKLNASNFKK